MEQPSSSDSPLAAKKGKGEKDKKEKEKDKKDKKGKDKAGKGEKEPPKVPPGGAVAWVVGGAPGPLPTLSTHLASPHRRKRGARSRRSVLRSCARTRPSCGCWAAARWC